MFSTATNISTSRSKRTALISLLQKHFGEKLLVLKVDDRASLICFRDFVPQSLKLVLATESDPIADAVQVITDNLQLNIRATS